MPLLFSYGSLQQASVQLATFGRLLNGRPDRLPKFEPSAIHIDDPEVRASTGATHHANVTFNGDGNSAVAGHAYEVGDDDLTRVDVYEHAFGYSRVLAELASGRQAWVYLYGSDPDNGGDSSARDSVAR